MKVLFTLPLLFACGAAAADDAAILQCRTLNDSGARLACYDAIRVPAGTAVSAAPLPAASAAAAVPASAPVPASVPATASPEQGFGMETRTVPPQAPKFIESTLDGDIDGWGPSTEFKLANGQVWRVTDGSDAALPHMHAPRVRIVRGMFGNMFLELPGTNNSPKVRRVR